MLVAIFLELFAVLAQAWMWNVQIKNSHVATVRF